MNQPSESIINANRIELIAEVVNYESVNGSHDGFQNVLSRTRLRRTCYKTTRKKIRDIVCFLWHGYNSIFSGGVTRGGGAHFITHNALVFSRSLSGCWTGTDTAIKASPVKFEPCDVEVNSGFGYGRRLPLSANTTLYT